MLFWRARTELLSTDRVVRWTLDMPEGRKVQRSLITKSVTASSCGIRSSPACICLDMQGRWPGALGVWARWRSLLLFTVEWESILRTSPPVPECRTLTLGTLLLSVSCERPRERWIAWGFREGRDHCGLWHPDGMVMTLPAKGEGQAF